MLKKYKHYIVHLHPVAQLQAGKTTTKNRHTQETKGTNEHDKKEPKKKEQQSP
jgi:hypothetical protein